MAWKPQDESPALGEEEGAVSWEDEAGEVAMPSWDQGISTSSGRHNNNDI